MTVLTAPSGRSVVIPALDDRTIDLLQSLLHAKNPESTTVCSLDWVRGVSEREQHLNTQLRGFAGVVTALEDIVDREDEPITDKELRAHLSYLQTFQKRAFT